MTYGLDGNHIGRSLSAINCGECGAVFSVRTAEVNRGRGKFCSRKCASIASARAGKKFGSGPDHPNFVSVDADIPLKDNARQAVHYAVRKGRLTKPKECSRCGGKQRIQAHHKDYEKPLDVVWLCEQCHRQEHY